MSSVEELRTLINAFQLSRAVQVAAVLGISDQLAAGPATLADLADRTECDAPTLGRLLAVLSAAGVYIEGVDKTYTNTELGDALRSDHPQRLRGWAMNCDRDSVWNTWSGLLTSIRTGENTFRALHGMSVWEYRATHLADNEAFDQGMTAYTLPVASAVAEVYDFADVETVVDVGGSHGILLAAILRANPAARGILFDQPQVVENALPELESAGVADRCQVVAGSFFESVPTGGDAYLLKSILHDWEDDECAAILEVCRTAMAPGARCLIVERVLGGPNEGLATKLSDLNMLVMPGGRERSVAEYERLLASAGFRLARVVPTATDFHVIESVAT